MTALKITAALVIIAVGLFLGCEGRLSSEQSEHGIRQNADARARRIYEETESAISAKRTREELIEQWQTLRV